MFFTADTHFDHKNVIKYCNRPFSSIQEMNQALIDKWNSKVKPGDLVFHLGDFAFGHDILKFTEVLNGDIILIKGNHDDKNIYRSNGFLKVHELLDTKINDTYITLCHFSMRVWEKSHFDSWHCFGHSHGSLEPFGKSRDVGVDNNNFEPIEFEELKKIMNDRPSNFNAIKSRYVN